MAERSYEMVVVDDGSPDGTAEVAGRLTERYPVRVLVREGRRGVSSAAQVETWWWSWTPTFNIRQTPLYHIYADPVLEPAAWVPWGDAAGGGREGWCAMS